MQGSLDPLVSPPCTDKVVTNCFNYSALNPPFIPGNWSQSGNWSAPVTDYRRMVEVNEYARSLTDYTTYKFGVDPTWRRITVTVTVTLTQP